MIDNILDDVRAYLQNKPNTKALILDFSDFVTADVYTWIETEQAIVGFTIIRKSNEENQVQPLDVNDTISKEEWDRLDKITIETVLELKC